MEKIALIGYSGHGLVVYDIFKSNGRQVKVYSELIAKTNDPNNLLYIGNDNDQKTLLKLRDYEYHVSIGNNTIRRKITNHLYSSLLKNAINAIHSNASISPSSTLGSGVMVGNGCIINACSIIANGVICNTQSVIEHECQIGAFAHIAPGAVLCGNVIVGENSFIGARSVIKNNIKIGSNVIVGAGTVVIRDVPDDSIVVGNPQKIIA